MKPRSLILILSIIGIPCGVLVWAAVRIARSEQVVVRQQFHDLMEQRLFEVNDHVERFFQQVEAQLQDLTSVNNPAVSALRRLGRTDPLVMQMFLLSPDGHLQYPSLEQELNSRERNFLLRASRMFSEQHLSVASTTAVSSSDDPAIEVETQESMTRLPEQTRPATRLAAPQSGVPPPAVTTATGWFVWYWDRGLNLIYWNRRPSGQVVGVALDRSRWMADLVGQLPDSPAENRSGGASQTEPRIRLVNAASEPVYQWGARTDETTEAVCEIALTAPLSSWRLQCLIIPGRNPGSSSGPMYGLAGGVTAVSVAVGLLAFVLIRDFTRDVREAGRQVSFVNQVSHELKTPLTNICLYAELLDRDMDGLPEQGTQQPRKRLNVILSEGRRLSRLIGNVLTFARQKRQALQPAMSPCVPDDIIRQVLEHFHPALAALDVRVETQLTAAETRKLDSDFLEQILGNLVGNVEKYAADSELLIVRSVIEDDTLVVDVIDDGPGIPVQDRDRVFEPFVRLSQDLSSAAGTGIGLSISRELARLHGGEIRLLKRRSGCHFVVRLRIL